MKKQLLCGLAVAAVAMAALVLAVAPADAASLVYEPFGGGVDTSQLDSSTATGVGFGANTWQDVGTNGNHINRNAWTPQFPVNVPFTAPNSLGVESNQSGGTTWSQLQSSRNFDGVSLDLGQDGEFYISFARRVWNNDTWGAVSLHNSATGNLGLAVGHRWGGNNAAGNPYQITGPLASPVAGLFGTGNWISGVPDQAHATGENLFYVARVATSAAGTDQVFLKVYRNGTDSVHGNPSMLAGQGVDSFDKWSLISTGGSSGLVLNQLRLSTSGAGFAQFDEIRIGETWADVTGMPTDLSVVNGDFETPNIGPAVQVQDVPNWFDSTGTWTAWQYGENGIHPDNGTQSATMRGDGFIYQSLGRHDATEGELLQWSFEQGLSSGGNSSTGFDLSFYTGSTTAAAEGIDITTLGLTQLDSTVSFASLNSLGITTPLTRSGNVDLTGLADGTEIWLRIGGNGTIGQFAHVDNINIAVVSVPEPSTLALAALGLLSLGCVAWRRRRRA